MKVIYGIGKVKSRLIKSFVTIGIFDGVHLGHKFIINKLIKKARRNSGTSIVLTFDPHPVNILRPKKYLPLLLSLKHRIKLISDLGVDVCIVENFSRTFSRLTPEGFIKKLLVKKIKPKEVLVGSGFTFGKNAFGSIDMLRRFGKVYDFRVRDISPIRVGRERISSTKIRRLIIDGRLKKAAKFLGRNVSVFARVLHGEGKGKLLGYRTVNIHPFAEVLPPVGVYAAKVNFNKKKFSAMAYVGSRSTYTRGADKNAAQVETHIFNFNKNIYNRYVEIEFLKRIRDERRFSSSGALKRQIQRDEKSVKSFLKTFRKK